jgi:hypothetical protein
MRTRGSKKNKELEEESDYEPSPLQLPPFHHQRGGHPGPPRDAEGRVMPARGPGDELMEQIAARPVAFQRGSVLGGYQWWHTHHTTTPTCDGASTSSGAGGTALLLPSMMEVVKAVAYDPGLSIHENASALLVQLGTILHPSALHMVSGRECPFFRPLFRCERERDTRRNQFVTRQQAECMYVCPRRVKEVHGGGKVQWVRLMPHRNRSFYVSVLLGKDKAGQNVWEYAHRLVAWAMLGPLSAVSSSKAPPPVVVVVGGSGSKQQGGAGVEVVMHSCHHKLCLSPCHLVAGSRQENYVGIALEAFDRQLSLAERVLSPR